MTSRTRFCSVILRKKRFAEAKNGFVCWSKAFRISQSLCSTLPAVLRPGIRELNTSMDTRQKKSSSGTFPSFIRLQIYSLANQRRHSRSPRQRAALKNMAGGYAKTDQSCGLTQLLLHCAIRRESSWVFQRLPAISRNRCAPKQPCAEAKNNCGSLKRRPA